MNGKETCVLLTADNPIVWFPLPTREEAICRDSTSD